MSWHVQQDLLARYVAGDVDGPQAYSIEAHLPSCLQCSAQVAPLVDDDLLGRTWEGIEERLDAPRRSPTEALLLRGGVPEHLARLLGATPALRLSWLLGCALVLAFAVYAASRRPDGLYWFFVVAPLLPLAGVALAYGPDVDPTYEIGLAAPMRSFRLLLIRALAVLATTTAMASVAALSLPGLHLSAAAWLLPSLALTLASLALATRMSPLLACGALAVCWMLVATAGRALTADPLVVFGAAGQLSCAVVAALAAIALILNADGFERRGELT